MAILITGKNSYIGEHIRSHLEQHGHRVDEVDTIGDAWTSLDFSPYESVIHVAALTTKRPARQRFSADSSAL